MKKILLIIYTMIFVLSCSDSNKDSVEPEKPKEKPEIEIPIPEIVLPEVSGGITSSTEATFTSSVPWLINLSNTRAVPTWFTVSPLSGGVGSATITITITEDNPLYEDRSGYIVIKAEGITKTITVSQKKKEAVITSKDRYDVSSDGESFSVEVKSNVAYEVIVPDDFKDWLKHKKTKTRTAGLIASMENFEVEKASENNNREGIIVFRRGTLADTVKVFQAMKEVLTLNQNLQNISYSGNDELEIEVRTNVKYAVTIPDSIQSWISVTEPKNRAIRVDRFYLKIEKNETYSNRKGGITIKDLESDLSTVLTIQQAQENAIILSNKQVDVGVDGGIVEAEVQSNIPYDVKILDDAKWIKQLPTSRALKREIVKFSIDPITDHSSRRGEVVFINKATNISDTLYVSQNIGATLILSEKEFMMSSSDTIINVELKSNVKYEVIIADSIDWIVERETKSLTTFNHIFDIKENTTYDARKAEIIFKDIDTQSSDTLTINQEGKKGLIVGEKLFHTSSNDTIINISVKANVEYYIVMPQDVDWVVENKVRGLENFTHYFSIKQNPTYENRTAEILFKDKNSLLEDEIVKITQKPSLILAPGEYYVNKPGTLKDVLAEVGTNLDTITYLKIIGNISKDDYYPIRKLTKLKQLDLSETTYVNDGGLYIENSINNSTLKKVVLSNTDEVIPYDMFRYARNLQEVIIGQKVKKIEKNAFYDCSSLLKIVLPASIQEIEDFAFSYCRSLSSINFPEGLKLIGSHAFMATGLKGDLILPNSLTKIAKSLFSGVEFGGKLTLPNYLTEIGEYAFRGNSFTGPLVLPTILEKIGREAFGGNSFSGPLVILGKIEYIGSFAFTGNDFSSVEIQHGALEELLGAFNSCKQITKVSLPGSLKRVEGAFNACDQLKDVKLSEGIVCLDGFLGTAIENINIPKSVKEIGSFNIKAKVLDLSYTNIEKIGISAFGSNEYLTEIKFPESLLEIGIDAFRDCRKLEGTLTLPSKLQTIGARAFLNTNYSGKLKTPSSLIKIGASAFKVNLYTIGEKSFSEIELNEGLIELRGFEGNTMTKLVIPSTVEILGGFANCKNLKGELKLPPNIRVIESQAFYRCPGLYGDIVLNDKIESVGGVAFFETGITSLKVAWSTPPNHPYDCSMQALGVPCTFLTLCNEGVPVYIPKGTLAAYIDQWESDYNYIEY